ncbi:MAG: hypothetical protein IKZ04_03415 [Spirochaetaceae bacterium]|nr:hypothetical protein [Spirochaetaceae bacterium]
MARSLLQHANKLLRSRKFSEVVNLLQTTELDYSDSFDYHYLLGVACMYLGDIGCARKSFDAARKITVLDTRLLIAQAALFLRRGETGRAVEYYLDILDNEPSNKIALEALDFIRKQASGSPSVIAEWVSSGKIKRFYPNLGMHPAIYKTIITFVILAVCAIGSLSFISYKRSLIPPVRGDLSAFVLSVEEKSNVLQQEMATEVYRYILTSKQVNDSYAKALNYFKDYQDNLAVVEINRILNSNASTSVKHNAQILKNRMTEPTFDTMKSSFSYTEVATDPYLYIDCWVSWTGRVANAVITDVSYSCDLLVGYEKQKHIEGIVPLSFESAMNIDSALPVRVLGRLGIVEGKIHLFGKSVYQPLDGSSL